MSPALIGTRGQFSSDDPENVVPSLLAAPAYVDGVYVNIRLTSDSVPVLMHDATVDRTTDGTGAVSSLTLAQIQALDAGGGAQVPTLAEYLTAIRDTIDAEASAGDRRAFSRIFLSPRALATADLTTIYNAATDSAFSTLVDRYVWLFALIGSDTDEADAAADLRSLDATAAIGAWFPDQAGAAAAVAAITAPTVDGQILLMFPGGYNAAPATLDTVTGAGLESGITRAQGTSFLQTVPIAHQDDNVSAVFTPHTDRLAWWHAPDPQEQRPTVVSVLPGSHRATFEARVLTSFQTAADPDGVEIPILGGDVQYDGTADVFASISLTTVGRDEETGKSLRPRRAADLLAPYGNELWVRRGIDLGNETLWVPLGVFRITDAEQDDPFGPITLTGQDRMRGIIRAQLLAPRAYAPDTTVGDVVDDLVRDVYPDVAIAWDDATNLEPVGRQLVVERDRYAALREVAEAWAKVMFFDGLGILRIEAPPPADEIVWEVRAGRNGVLIRAQDAVSDEESFNAVVVTGEGVSGLASAARGVAVDRGVTSPTRFGGRFGKVPDFFASPLVLTTQQAREAAIARLRRNIGMTHVASFGTVVNPLLRPRQAIRLTRRDGTRDKHVMERCTVPLVADAAMDGTTREQTAVSVGAVIT